VIQPIANYSIIQVPFIFPNHSHSFFHQIDNPKNTFFSPKPRRSLFGAYQDLKQSIAKAFEVRTQHSTSQINKSLPLLASM
jgi:hypothetical protein